MANAQGWVIVGFLAILVASFGFIGWNQGWFTEQKVTAIPPSTTQQVLQATTGGDVATIGVIIYDKSATNTNAKATNVGIYCQDKDKNFIIDGTSSATTEVTGKTTRNNKVTCYAYNSTVQLVSPVTVDVDEEFEHVVLNVFTIPADGKLTFYSEDGTSSTTGLPGSVNLTGASSDGTGTLQKLRIKNNATSGEGWLPLGGMYFDTQTSTNVTDVTLASGGEKSTTWVENTVKSEVSSRNEKWDFAFEVDADSSKEGNQPIILEESEYIESGTISFKGDTQGCGTATNGAEELTYSYIFMKGYYRSEQEKAVKFGYETDADSASVITTDIATDSFYCKASET